MRESEIERYLIEAVRQAGGETRKVQWINRRFAPDRVVFLPSDKPLNRTVWVELKAPGQRPTPGQLREHEVMAAVGQIVVVIDSIARVDDLLKEYARVG